MAEKRVDTRGQWTIKHGEIGPEFQTLVRKAAERQGMTVGAFVVETLRERATGILKGEEGTPRSTPPARIEDVADALSARLAEMGERLATAQAERDWATTERMERLEREMAEQRARMERQWADEQRAARRGRWRR